MQIHRIIIATALVGASVGLLNPSRADELTDRINELDQKTRILERKLELSEEAAAAKAKESATVTAGKSGFALTSADKKYSLKLRGYAQADGRFYLDDKEDKSVDSFLVRRARVIFEGDLGERVSFRIAPDFGNGKSELQDAYVEFKPATAFNIRAGRTKVPFGLERLQSSTDTLFNETALSTALTPNYDEGVQLFGKLFTNTVEYAVGVFNGGPDGASVDSDSNDDKDLAGRLWFSPFRNSDVDAISGLSFGIAGTFGKQEGSDASTQLPNYKTSGQQTFFSYKTSTNKGESVVADGDHTRVSPQLYYQLGSLGLLAEYVTSEQDVSNSKGSDSLSHDAWQVAASYVLTGEKASLRGVEPASEFSLANGTWGAIELVARYSELSIDDKTFSGGYADAKKSASGAENTGVGINWYATRNTKISVDYETTAFDGGAAEGDRDDEQIIIARAQVKF